MTVERSGRDRRIIPTTVYMLATALFATMVGVYLYLVVQIPYTIDTFMRQLPERFQ